MNSNELAWVFKKKFKDTYNFWPWSYGETPEKWQKIFDDYCASSGLNDGNEVLLVNKIFKTYGEGNRKIYPTIFQCPFAKKCERMLAEDVNENFIVSTKEKIIRTIEVFKKNGFKSLKEAVKSPLMISMAERGMLFRPLFFNTMDIDENEVRALRTWYPEIYSALV